jgi:hypothetical protein
MNYEQQKHQIDQAQDMTVRLQANATAEKAHRQAKTMLATARKNLRILSHAAKDGNPKVTNDILAAAAIKVATLETIENTARNLIVNAA